MFTRLAAQILCLEEGILQEDLKRLLLKFEALWEQGHSGKQETSKAPALSAKDKDEALDFLKDSALTQRIVNDFTRCGCAGEDETRLLLYLVAVSRKLPQPLAVVIQSSSAAGKSALMKAAWSFVPEEECEQYSAMTAR